jgi:hypothetical protein
MGFLRFILGIVVFVIAVKLLGFLLGLIGFVLHLAWLAFVAGLVLLVLWGIYKLVCPTKPLQA